MLRVIFLLTLIVPASAAAQDSGQAAPESFGIAHLTEYLGMKPDDISFRSDYTDPDSFRMAVVANLMTSPLQMVEFSTNLKNGHLNGQPEILARYLFKQAATERQPYRDDAYRASAEELQGTYNLYYNDITFNQVLTRSAGYLDVIFPRSTEKSLALLTRDQRKFLRNEFKQILMERDDDEGLSVETLDSLDKIEEAYCDQFVQFGYKFNKDPVLDAGINCLRELLLEINNLRARLKTGAVSAGQIMEGTGYLPDNADRDAYLGLQTGWRVGGTGNDYYKGDYRFIFDFGGDDVYDLSYDPANPHGVIIIDLSGDDCYRSQSDFTLGSGCFSVGLLLDFAGDDRYDSRSFALGSGYFGLGILYDAEGNDRYDGDQHVQGAGSFGIGLLIDEGGRDIYNSAIYSQGFGFVEGIGVVYDLTGSDSYYAGGKYTDVLRYDNHYLSLSQGFGYGLRPWMSGGIGAMIDLEGHDNYYSDIFAQAASYWWSMGLIYDSSGNDSYQCYQYGQGAATHMTLGLLVDDYGDDVYFGKGLMQGCGHDYSCGMILDRHGNDTYTAYDLSQGAGSANGVGVLVDNEGDDRYLVRENRNTQGYGNPRRDFGSIGMFIDLGGTDQYQGNGGDNCYWQTDSKWGGGMDIELYPPASAEGNK
ncbi:MAG: hypothetical protein AB1483_05065 [Candidatus Zixiibacteriota bacterium]